MNSNAFSEKKLVWVIMVVREHEIVGGIAPDQYYTHLFSACLKLNLLLKLEVFYLQVDNTPCREIQFFGVWLLGLEFITQLQYDWSRPEIPSSCTFLPEDH